jgi:hypothetical protein
MKNIGLACLLALFSLSFTPSWSSAQTIVPDAFDFGIVATGNSSAPQDFTFANTFVAALVMTPASLVGPGAAHFTIDNDGCAGQNLAPGQMCIVTVSFSPLADGAHQATLMVNFSDPNGAPGSGNADLTGLAPIGALSADLSIDLALNATQVAPGAAVNVSVTLANAGPDNAINLEAVISLPVGSTSISGGGNGVVCVVVNQTATCTLPQLDALADVTFDIGFNAPAAAGGYSVAGTVESDTFDPVAGNNSDFEQLVVAGTPPPASPAQPVPAFSPMALMVLVALVFLASWRTIRF